MFTELLQLASFPPSANIYWILAWLFHQRAISQHGYVPEIFMNVLNLNHLLRLLPAVSCTVKRCSDEADEALKGFAFNYMKSFLWCTWGGHWYSHTVWQTVSIYVWTMLCTLFFKTEKKDVIKVSCRGAKCWGVVSGGENSHRKKMENQLQSIERLYIYLWLQHSQHAHVGPTWVKCRLHV